MHYLPKKYRSHDASLGWILSYNCNFDCSYCGQAIFRKKGLISEKISEIDIAAFQKTLSETNKIFTIDFTGGETFFIPNIIEACIELTKNHFVNIWTNLTSERVKEFIEKINPERVPWINASFHIKELEKHNLVDKFISNFHLFKKNGFNIRALEVADPHLINEAKKYKKFLKKKGISLEFMPYVGGYNGKMYPASYTKKELKEFGIKKKRIAIHFQKGNLCNAGYNTVGVDPEGNLISCPFMEKNLGNVYEKIRFNDKMIRCPFEICGCGLYKDNYIYKKAIRETKSTNSSNLILLIKYKLNIYLERVGNKMFQIFNRKKILHFYRKHRPFIYYAFPILKSLHKYRELTKKSRRDPRLKWKGNTYRKSIIEFNMIDSI